MRFVVARRLGRRGEGLGNEILPWAKGWIASQALNASLIGPAWGINRRKYYRNFRTSRMDVICEELLAHLPHFAFTEADYRNTGEIDFGSAIGKWAESKGLPARRSFIVTVDGMYGGYTSIRNARPFLWSRLLNSRDALRNVYQIASRLDRSKLFVAVHMRLADDFDAPLANEDQRGKFNIKIPGEWYLALCETLRETFGDSVQFHFFTDRGGPAFDEAVRRFNPGQSPQQGLTECSDLLLMAMADLRVCSVSSYSMIAGFLSDGPYIWYEPQLTVADGMYSLWGREEAQRKPGSATHESIQQMKSIVPGTQLESSFKGYGMEAGSPLPRGLVEQLRRKLAANQRSASLLEYGCLPEWVMKQR
jgi:hypothetical protein